MMQGDPEYNVYQVKYIFDLHFLALMVKDKLKYYDLIFFCYNMCNCTTS